MKLEKEKNEEVEILGSVSMVRSNFESPKKCVLCSLSFLKYNI